MADQDSSVLKFLEQISKKLTLEVLIDVLKKLTNDDNIIFDGITQQSDSVKKGDSYFSSLFHFNVNGSIIEESGSKRSVSYPVIAKGLPQNIARRKTCRSTDFFESEINFYTKVWPRLLKYQKDKEVIVFDNVPRCLAALCDGENDYIILEDITLLEYNTLEKSYTLDLDHCMLIMRLFANFHSISFAFKSQRPKEYNELVSHLKENYFSEQLRSWYRNFLKNLWGVWSDALKKEAPNTIYQRKFEILMKNDFYGQITKLVEIKGKYSVVCQGDAWLPNFMFKYNEETPESVYLIDFKLARNSSLILDLAVFLFVCVGYSIRTVHWDELLTEYHTTFTSNLQKFGVNPSVFTYRDLQSEFLKYGKFGLGIGIEALPFTMLEGKNVSNLDAMEGEERVDIATVWKVKNLTLQQQRLRLVDTIKDMVDRGFLEQYIFNK